LRLAAVRAVTGKASLDKDRADVGVVARFLTAGRADERTDCNAEEHLKLQKTQGHLTLQSCRGRWRNSLSGAQSWGLLLSKSSEK
jgi:hypothetical protein